MLRRIGLYIGKSRYFNVGILLDALDDWFDQAKSINPRSVTISTLLIPSELHSSDRFPEAPGSQKIELQAVNVKGFML